MSACPGIAPLIGQKNDSPHPQNGSSSQSHTKEVSPQCHPPSSQSQSFDRLTPASASSSGFAAVPSTTTLSTTAPPLPDYIALTHSPIDINEVMAKVMSPYAGAVSTFAGTTRNTFEGKKVLRLEYEAYESMVRTPTFRE